jgi:hypothetical protein
LGSASRTRRPHICSAHSGPSEYTARALSASPGHPEAGGSEAIGTSCLSLGHLGRGRPWHTQYEGGPRFARRKGPHVRAAAGGGWTNWL